MPGEITSLPTMYAVLHYTVLISSCDSAVVGKSKSSEDPSFVLSR